MEESKLSELVALAKKKDSKAMEELYERTYSIAYYTALEILKNGQDALDIVQDSYINVFGKLNELQGNGFLRYLKVTVANTCRNRLKRRNPILFNSDEEESNVLDGIEEQGEDFLPDSYLEYSEKREQIMSIINGLADVQRATILFFYYDDMSISEIADAMECSESTVESRISYAKKHIRAEVEKLEKQGDKLYGKAFIPVPFLERLFLEDSKNHVLPESVAKTIFHNVITPSAAAGTSSLGGAAAASGLFAKIAGLSVLGKSVFAGVAAIVIVGGGILGAAATGHLNNNSSAKAAAVASSLSVSSNPVSSTPVSSIDEEAVLKQKQADEAKAEAAAKEKQEEAAKKAAQEKAAEQKAAEQKKQSSSSTVTRHSSGSTTKHSGGSSTYTGGSKGGSAGGSTDKAPAWYDGTTGDDGGTVTGGDGGGAAGDDSLTFH